MVSRDPSDSLWGFARGLEHRDTLMCLMPGPSCLLLHLFRVPLACSTVAGQVLATGTGALWIDGSRVRTSPQDAKAMERATTPGSGRMYASESPIGTFVRSSSSGPLDTTKGRWPPNLLLVHHPECRDQGVRRVKGIVAGNTVATRRSGVHAGAKGHQTIGREQAVNHYADPDGLETVQAWLCVEGCPVGLLDRQSGVSESAVRRGDEGEHLDPSKRNWRFKRAQGGFTDTGGASRFFPGFTDLAECLVWVDRLINGPGPV